MIKTVLRNLISNAIKYTEQGCITLSLYQTVHNEVAYTEIKVSDTGYGISAEALPHIFDRYYQESGKHQASGTGIGLALVKNLVELHEGEIRAESVQNEGSTFYISLLTDNIYPNALHADSTEPVQEETNPEASLEYPQEATLDTGKPILLIVEDNESIREMLANIFKPFYQILTAANGEEGWQLVRGEMPCIVVSDVVMPKMSGTELCKLIKSDFNTCHIPVVLLTARTAVELNIEGLRIGADDYITKPFHTNLLISRCNNLVNSRILLQEKFSKQPQTAAQMLATNPIDQRHSGPCHGYHRAASGRYGI